MLIPTNVITGFLGVGKTTAILNLLATKPTTERWAVLVNETGEVSIDHAIFAGAADPETVTVREVSGGCFCCVTAPYLQVALYLLLTQSKPDRLIVETTGLGHPSSLLETLCGEHYRDRLDVRATLTILSPDDFQTTGMLNNPVFHEQIEVADVLVLNKLDRSSPELTRKFQVWSDGLAPKKQLIVATENGVLDPAWLDVVPTRRFRLEHDDSQVLPSPNQPEPIPQSAEPGRPSRHQSPPSVAAMGWIFHPDDRFDEAKLYSLLSQLKGISRLKGVFQLQESSIIINRTSSGTVVNTTEYVTDSRVEIFAENVSDWEAIERKLVRCLAESKQHREKLSEDDGT